MSVGDTDLQIIEKVQRGDKQAFNLLVHKYQHKVINLVSRYVKHPGDVADVAQDTFIRAYRAMPSFRGDSAFYTWLYRIAVNTAKNYITAQQKRVASSDIDVEEAQFMESAHALKMTETPENLLTTSEMKKVVFDTIESLQDDLKTAITLREIDGLSYEEIAKIMLCPVGTVRSRIFRAREVIDRQLQPYMQR
jgi:RNA polymerase sigma-70 factor (ECF subfamily)